MIKALPLFALSLLLVACGGGLSEPSGEQRAAEAHANNLCAMTEGNSLFDADAAKAFAGAGDLAALDKTDPARPRCGRGHAHRPRTRLH